MRKRQHTLLAGVAALALFAASGIALAQQGQQGKQDQRGAGGAAQNTQSQRGAGGAAQNTQSQRSEQGGKNQAASQGLKNQGAQRGNEHAMSRQSAGQNAQSESKTQPKGNARGNMTAKGNAAKGEKSFDRSAQRLKQNKGAGAANRTAEDRRNQLNAQSKTTQSKTGQFASQPNKERGLSTQQRNTQRNEQLKGLQSSTRSPVQGATSTRERSSGAANVSLNEQQRTQIRETVINSRSAPRVSNVDFSVNVGTVVPRGHIHLVRVPETLVRIEPRWRRFVYFVYNNEIVIVDPRTMRIIEVLPV